MSIRLMTLVWNISFPTQSQKLIALKLADYASDYGASIFPSNETLGRQAGCDERTAQRVLKVFCECGLIKLVKQGGKGPYSTNEWKLNVPLLEAIAAAGLDIQGGSGALEIPEAVLATFDSQKDDRLSSLKGDTLPPLQSTRVTRGPLRVTPVSSKGDTGVTQSINNHHIDSSRRACAREPDDGLAQNAHRRVVKAIRITDREACWDAWIDHLRSNGHAELADRAVGLGKMMVPERWPRADSPLPQIDDAPKTLTAQSRRQTGEHAE